MGEVFRDFTKNYPIITRGKGVFLYDRRGGSILTPLEESRW